MTTRRARAVRVTRSPEANDQLLYFTSSSLRADDKRLVFISDRTGHPNLFLLEMETGLERQLTFNTEGYLKSYVYHDGTPYCGLGKASVSLHAESGRIYYIQGREIRMIDAEGRPQLLAEYPHGQMTAFTHVSADGTRLCVPTVDARALSDEERLPVRPDYDIDERVQRENLSSYLRIYDTSSGEELSAEPVRRGWVTHVQFSPIDRELVLYNHEWSADKGIRRMWLWDGMNHHRLRNEGEGRRRTDWACHEMWERDGEFIIYHGGYANKGPTFIGRMRADGSDLIEIPFPPGWTRYGHFTVGRPGVLVCDGYYMEEEHAAGSCGEWISVLKVDWRKRQIEWQPLCRHGSSWDSQDSHPHPIFDHAANTVYFTSDRDGKRAIYRIAAPALS